MACSASCRLCRNLVISQSVSIVTVDGTDTLVIDLPLRAYDNGSKYCIVIAQSIPTTATISMPVAFSIGGDTSIVYPFTRCDCSQVTACGIRTRTRYSTIVATTPTSGVFKSLGGLSCAPVNNLVSLPAPTEATITTTTTDSVSVTPNKTIKTVTTTKKEVVENA